MVPLLIGAAAVGLGAVLMSDDKPKQKTTTRKNGEWIEEITTREVSIDEIPPAVREKIQRKETSRDNNTTNFCPYCGTKVLSSDAKFCSGCGKSLVDN